MVFTPKATYEQELLSAARAVARLQTQRRKLRRQLKQVNADLRHERKMLRALANRNDERRPDVIPSRLFGDGVGYAPRLTLDAADGGDAGAAAPLDVAPKTGTDE